MLKRIAYALCLEDGRKVKARTWYCNVQRVRSLDEGCPWRIYLREIRGDAAIPIVWNQIESLPQILEEDRLDNVED